MMRPRFPDGTGARAGLLAAFWLFVGLFGGTAGWLGERVAGGDPTWRAAVLPALGAALLWIPLTLAAVWLARRFPLFPLPAERWWLSVGVHALAALSVGFVLNLAFFAGEAALPGRGRSAAGLLAAAGIAGVRFLHINAGVYLGIVALSWVWAARSLPTEPAGPPPAGDDEPYARRLRAAAAGRVTLLEVDEIEWIEADGDYARVHLGGADHLVSERMKQLEERLDPARFVRIHRSHIVNVERVRELRHLSHGDYEVTLAGDVSLRVSRGRRKQLLDAVERARG